MLVVLLFIYLFFYCRVLWLLLNSLARSKGILLTGTGKPPAVLYPPVSKTLYNVKAKGIQINHFLRTIYK